MKKHDPVNHPKHYTSHPSGVECINITRHFGFNLGNVIKYLWRAEDKGAPLEDLKKAAWYLNDEIKRREGTLLFEKLVKMQTDAVRNEAFGNFEIKPTHINYDKQKGLEMECLRAELGETVRSIKNRLAATAHPKPYWANRGHSLLNYAEFVLKFGKMRKLIGLKRMLEANKK